MVGEKVRKCVQRSKDPHWEWGFSPQLRQSEPGDPGGNGTWVQRGKKYLGKRAGVRKKCAG